jgi:hypothetical protein
MPHPPTASPAGSGSRATRWLVLVGALAAQAGASIAFLRAKPS